MDPRDDRDRLLERAHLLIVRKRYGDARRILLGMQASGLRDPDVECLLDDLLRVAPTQKERERRWSEWRYWLHLNSWWRRIVWGIVGGVLFGYHLYELSGSLALGFVRGFPTQVTTMVEVGGRYSRHLEPWTRPIYFDVLYDTALVALGASMLVVVYVVSRNVPDWEELEGVDEPPVRPPGLGW